SIGTNTLVSSGDLINGTVDTTSTGNFLRFVNEATEKFKVDVDGAVTAVGGATLANLSTAGVVTNTSAGLLGTLAGTTTTVLHGNAAGLPTYGSVVGGDLAANITISTTGNISTTGTGTITSAGAIAANGGITFDNSTDTVGAHTLGGGITGNSQSITALA